MTTMVMEDGLLRLLLLLLLLLKVLGSEAEVFLGEGVASRLLLLLLILSGVIEAVVDVVIVFASNE